MKNFPEKRPHLSFMGNNFSKLTSNIRPSIPIIQFLFFKLLADYSENSAFLVS